MTSARVESSWIEMAVPRALCAGRAKYGWSPRLKRRGRVVLYLSPQRGSFLLGVVLGERAAMTANDSGQSKAVLSLIDDAPRRGEGRRIRLVVSAAEDPAAAKSPAALKMAK